MRKGSKGIKNKNLLKNKKPLMVIQLTLQKSNYSTRIISPTVKILTKAKNYNVDGYLRPKYGKDSSPKSSIRHALLFAEKI